MAEKRVINPSLPRAYSWTNLVDKPETVQVGDTSDHTALVKAWHKRVADAKATPRKNASIGLHLLAIVSDEWLKEGEGVAKQKSHLFYQARRWADKTFGPGSLFGARIDLNEQGRSTVDLFVCPVRTQRIGRGRVKKQMVAPTAALADVSVSMGRPSQQSYAALQDSWAAHCTEHLDERIKRGKPKGKKGPIHLSPEDYGREKDKRRGRAIRRLLGAFRKTAPRLFKAVAGDDMDLVEPLAKAKDATAHKEMPIYEETIERLRGQAKKTRRNFRRLSDWLWRSGRWPEFAESADEDLKEAAYQEAEQVEIERRKAKANKARMIELARSGLRQRDPEERQEQIRRARKWSKERGSDYRRQRRAGPTVE
ncbi:MAG: hypothetical protein F4118_12545 [Acidimicrobiaceae bacterium]|nr:hypothetical protein [Acidimicrobiaceae bacterium]